jgi:hypothetical protein
MRCRRRSGSATAIWRAQNHDRGRAPAHDQRAVRDAHRFADAHSVRIADLRAHPECRADGHGHRDGHGDGHRDGHGDRNGHRAGAGAHGDQHPDHRPDGDGDAHADSDGHRDAD